MSKQLQKRAGPSMDRRVLPWAYLVPFLGSFLEASPKKKVGCGDGRRSCRSALVRKVPFA
jgi:hypothetical protein